MTKKIFAIIIACALMLATSTVFANEMGDSMNKATNTARDVVGGAENVVEDAAGAIGTGVRDLGNTFSAGAARVTNNQGTNTDNYNATRTTATRSATNDNTFLGMSANTWTWFILAIVALAIVGLVWYYAMQNKNEYTNTNNH